MALEVEVKDSTRNLDKWAYYSFQPNAKAAEAMPKGNDCWSPATNSTPRSSTLSCSSIPLEACGKRSSALTTKLANRSDRSRIWITFRTRRQVPRKCLNPLSRSPYNKDSGDWTVHEGSDTRTTKRDLSKRSAGYASTLSGRQDRPMVDLPDADRSVALLNVTSLKRHVT